MMKDTIYFDHNSTTPIHPEVLKAMVPFYKDAYGNASSLHAKGKEARNAVDRARKQIGSFLGTEPEDVIFTSGGTESNNLAIKGVCWANKRRGKHIITSQIEHLSALSACQHMERQGYEVTYLPVDGYGIVHPGELEKAILPQTILVSIMHANNEVGTIEPIKQLAKVAREKGALFHTDAVQTFGKIPIDVEDMGVDLLSISGHKIYGPKGIGALYIRKGVEITPLFHGGHHERGLRPGTENVTGIVGLGKSVELARANMEREAQRMAHLRDRFYDGIVERVKDVRLNGHPTKRLPNVLNFSFRFIEAESLMANLDLRGICASAGSACTSGTSEPSHVLTAMGIPPKTAKCAVRFSLGLGNTAAQIDYCLKVLPRIAKKLRISPHAHQPSLKIGSSRANIKS